MEKEPTWDELIAAAESVEQLREIANLSNIVSPRGRERRRRNRLVRERWVQLQRSIWV